MTRLEAKNRGDSAPATATATAAKPMQGTTSPVRAVRARKTSGAAVPKPVEAPLAVSIDPPAAVPVVRRRRSNRRSEQTIANILAATEQVVLESGADRISILDVCAAAGVSRGTFYRYFASQDELLDAFSRHKRERFHIALTEATAPFADPDARFEAMTGYLENYLEQTKVRRMLLVAPEYALNFFKRIFHDSVVRFQDVLSIVFDAWEERLGIKLDRELICEMMIRYVLSELLVPGDAGRKSITRRIGRMVEALVAGAPTRVKALRAPAQRVA
jgi:AcrR family transcriptional regulator